MKLTFLKIDTPFRNLNGFKVDFRRSDDTVVFIGNNGSGKSNILEALSEIFGHLLYGTPEQIPFFFKLTYNIGETSVAISSKGGGCTYKVNNKSVDKLDSQYLPARLVCNYSGEDLRLWNHCYEPYYKSFYKSLKETQIETLRMVYVGRQTWMTTLLVMIINYKKNESIRQFLTSLNHPIENARITITFNKSVKDSWEKENRVTALIEQLNDMRDQNGQINLDVLSKIDLEPRDLYHLLIGAQKAIDDISINFSDGVNAMLLSEGEKKMMDIVFVLECLADEKTLVLMDEPDSHIHVSRKVEMKKAFDSVPNRNNIITTHSPSLAAAFDDNAIYMLDKDVTGKVCVDIEKQEIINTLTEGQWSYHEQNIFLSSQKDVLFLEGTTDEYYIKASLDSYHKKSKYLNLSFEYVPCGGASHLKTLSEKFMPKQGQTLMAFWDYDKAGEASMQAVFGKDLNLKNFGKAQKKGYVWFAFYPRRRRPDGSTEWKKGFNVEDYFTKTTLMNKYIRLFSSLNEIISKDSLKDLLKKDCIEGNFAHKELRYFSFLFELIIEIKKAEQEGRSQI